MREHLGVTFDWWGTLYRHRDVGDERVRRVLRMAASQCVALTEPEVRAAYRAGAEKYDCEWRSGRVYHPRAWVDEMLGQLGLALPEPERRNLQAALEEAILVSPPTMIPGARELLVDLNASGVRLGVISDTGMTVGRVMRGILQGDQVLRCFQGLAFSDELGAVKPDRLPYEVALRGMGLAPEQAVHVGDLPHTDIQGAKDLGMRAVLITGVTGQPDDGRADASVKDFAELRALFQRWGLLKSGD